MNPVALLAISRLPPGRFLSQNTLRKKRLRSETHELLSLHARLQLRELTHNKLDLVTSIASYLLSCMLSGM